MGQTHAVQINARDSVTQTVAAMGGEVTGVGLLSLCSIFLHQRWVCYQKREQVGAGRQKQ